MKRKKNLARVLTRCAAVYGSSHDAKFVELGYWYAALSNPPRFIGRYHHFVGKERENNFGMAQGVFDDTAVNGHEMDRIRWRKAPWPTVCKKVVLVKAVRLFGAAALGDVVCTKVQFRITIFGQCPAGHARSPEIVAHYSFCK